MSTPDVSRPGPLTAWSRLPRTGRRPLAGGWRLGYPRLLAALPSLVLCITAWVIFAPTQLGGPVSYAVTSGVSMLPNFHAGDLVLLRSQPSYHVGEVAGYHNGRLGVTVMHRIVAVDGDHYVFKGDNNTWVDSYQPTAGQIVGAEWIHLPGWGSVLLALRAPVAVAILLGLMWMVVFWPRSATRRERRRHRHAH